MTIFEFILIDLYWYWCHIDAPELDSVLASELHTRLPCIEGIN